MMKLENKRTPNMSLKEADHLIDSITERLDQKEAIDRKIKFFLDIRGYLKVNSIKGNYIEFGSFRSITQYGAYKVLDNTGTINKYVGLDTFKGEPRPTKEEKQHHPYDNTGDFSCSYNDVLSFVKEAFQGKGVVIQGDFRDESILEKVKKYTPINVAMIDCNLVSSIEKSLEFVFQYATPGCVILIDDYFSNFGKGEAIIQNTIERIKNSSEWKLIEHSFYPPVAKSFILSR